MTPTQKLSKTRSILLSIFIVLFVLTGAYTMSGSTAIYNQVRYLFGIGWTSHSTWSFSTTGNGGTILFWARPIDGYSGAHLFIPALWTQVLTGSFWSETAGWMSMDNVEFNLTDTVNNIWSLSGYAWSESAGWLDFSGVTYQLSNTSFSGFAWNDGIGWIDMSEASIEMTSSWSIWMVKILWTLWSNRIFDTIYNLDGEVTATTTDIINDVRKNVALLKRNIPSTKINTSIDGNRVFEHGGWLADIGGKIFFENTSTSPARVQFQRLDGTMDTQRRVLNTALDTPVYSVIAIGADIYLNDSVRVQQDGKPRVFIALKNTAWVWGNIYIDGSITQVYASLVAEGSIYSGEFSWPTAIYYNDDATDLFKIPNRQLYVYGSLISNNTIWGYRSDNIVGNKCPYNVTPCNDSNALKYDFNHFRDFQKTSPDSALLRWYQPPWESLQDTYDDYSMIIEHDFRILDNPPPWLESIQ